MTRLDESKGETTHRWATFLPDGRHFLYMAGTHAAGAGTPTNVIYLASLDSKDRKPLLVARSNVAFASCYLIYVLEKTLLAQPFDEVAHHPLMAAALKGHVEVAKMLVGNGAEVNSPGWSALHYAAFENRPEMIKYLLERCADKNAVAPNEFMPLMLAVRNGHEDAARALLYGDPDVNYRTRSSGDSALRLAMQKGYVPVVDLLKRAGAVE